DPGIRSASHTRDSNAVFVVLPLPVADGGPDGLETPECVLVPSCLSRHLSASLPVLPHHRGHRFFTRPGRPSDIWHRLSVCGKTESVLGFTFWVLGFGFSVL